MAQGLNARRAAANRDYHEFIFRVSEGDTITFPIMTTTTYRKSGTLYWGDGTSIGYFSTSSYTHTYEAAGDYSVIIRADVGTIDAEPFKWSFRTANCPISVWLGKSVVTITNSAAFCDCNNMTYFRADGLISIPSDFLPGMAAVYNSTTKQLEGRLGGTIFLPEITTIPLNGFRCYGVDNIILPKCYLVGNASFFSSASNITLADYVILDTANIIDFGSYAFNSVITDISTISFPSFSSTARYRFGIGLFAADFRPITVYLQQGCIYAGILGGGIIPEGVVGSSGELKYVFPEGSTIIYK